MYENNPQRASIFVVIGQSQESIGIIHAKKAHDINKIPHTQIKQVAKHRGASVPAGILKKIHDIAAHTIPTIALHVCKIGS
jgi:hypothetical protein